MSIRHVRAFFDFGTPGFSALDRSIRFSNFREVAKSDLPGLIFTLVWAFDHPEDHAYVEEIANVFTDQGGEVLILELEGPLSERLRRNIGADRLLGKPSKRNLARSEEVLLNEEGKYRMNSAPGELQQWRHLRVDNTELSPEEMASIVHEHFSLKAPGD